MNVVYALDDGLIAQLHGLYQREWWSKDRSLEETRACVSGSDVCIGLVSESGKLTGFARLLTDYVFKALIFDVIVSAEARGQGLGDELLAQIRKHDKLKAVKHFELYCLPEMFAFYEKHGFSKDVGEIALMRLENH